MKSASSSSAWTSTAATACAAFWSRPCKESPTIALSTGTANERPPKARSQVLGLRSQVSGKTDAPFIAHFAMSGLRETRPAILQKKKPLLHAEAFHIRIKRPPARLHHLHENNNQREQNQRLDEGEAEDQGYLNAGAGSRIASERFARRRRGTTLALRRQSRCDGDRETRSDCYPVGPTSRTCSSLSECRHSHHQEHHHHEQQHYNFPHLDSPL